MLSFLPTVFCSFVPISLWGIFVIGSITPNIDRAGLSLFLSAIPFNFFSIIAVLGIDELGVEDKATVARARRIQRFLSQPFHVAENFTGMEGKYVPLSETIKGFQAILSGDCDDLPEQAFLMAGTIDEVLKKREV